MRRHDIPGVSIFLSSLQSIVAENYAISFLIFRFKPAQLSLFPPLFPLVSKATFLAPIGICECVLCSHLEKLINHNLKEMMPLEETKTRHQN